MLSNFYIFRESLKARFVSFPCWLWWISLLYHKKMINVRDSLVCCWPRATLFSLLFLLYILFGVDFEISFLSSTKGIKFQSTRKMKIFLSFLWLIIIVWFCFLCVFSRNSLFFFDFYKQFHFLSKFLIFDLSSSLIVMSDVSMICESRRHFELSYIFFW